MLFALQKVHFKTTSLTEPAVNGNRSLVHLYQFLHQRKTDAGACLIENILVHQVLKAYKERLTFIFGNTNPLILYADRHRALIFTDKDGDHFPIRSIFKRIGQKVKHNLFKLIGIHPKIQSLFLCLEKEIDVVFFRHRLKIIHNLADKGNDIQLLYLHLHLLVLNLTKVQNLIDQTKHTVGIPFEHYQLFPCISRQFIVLQNLFHRTCNQCQRSTEFMGYIRKEAQLDIRNLLFYRHLMLQPINGKQDINRNKNNQQHKADIQHIRQRRLPERRENRNVQDALIVHPHPVTIGRTDTEYIISLRKVSISHASLPVGKSPLLLETIENVCVLYVLRIRIIECSILNGKDILIMRKHQFLCIIQIDFQYGLLSRNYIFIRYHQLRKNYRRHIATLPDRIRSEHE